MYSPVNILPKQVIIIANFEIKKMPECIVSRIWVDFLFNAAENTSAILRVKITHDPDMATPPRAYPTKRYPSATLPCPQNSNAVEIYIVI